MSDTRIIGVVDRLRALPSEAEWYEFKRNHYEPQQLGEYLSALANSACLAGEPRGYLVFGVDDGTHEVVGTSFDPYAVKGKGNQDLLPWLAAWLHPNTGFETHVVDYPGKRVVVFEIGPAREQPVSFHGVSYIRVGSSKTELSRHPEKARALWTRGHDWSGEVCEGATLNDLDPDAIVKAREQFVVKHPAQAANVASWDDVTFLNKAKVLRQGSVTHAALLLLGRPEASTLLSPTVAKISWILKDAANRELDYEHFAPPFLLAGDRLQGRIRNLIVRAMPGGTLFPKEITQYDPWVVREALHNCIAHQDYGLHGRVAVVEFPDRLLVTNVGDFLPGDVATVIRQDAPPPVYRNPFLADAMVELNLIDTQGGGIKRMFETQRLRSFPLPDYDLSKPGIVSVTLSGRILDEHYTRLLMERTDLDLDIVMLLDKVQKRLRISHEDHARLKKSGMVEGRYPYLFLAAGVARATGQKARHVREGGLDTAYYRELILTLAQKHGPITRSDIDALLLNKLPDILGDAQRKTRIHHLISELARDGRIVNRGSRRYPQWTIGDAKARRNPQ